MSNNTKLALSIRSAVQQVAKRDGEPVTKRLNRFFAAICGIAGMQRSELDALYDELTKGAVTK